MPKSKGINNSWGAFGACYSTYRSIAKRRKIFWELTKEEFDGLSQGDCFYCGCPPKNEFAAKRIGKYRGYRYGYIYSGIDRVDNNKGYIIENCVSCCKECNSMKEKSSIEDFLEQVRRIYENISNVIDDRS